MIIDLVVLVNACMVAFSYMLSIQVMKCTIKLLPLLKQCLASRAVKQLKEQIIITVLTLADATTHNSTLVLPHSLLCRAISLAITPCMEVGLAMQDQHNPHTHT